MNLPTDYAAVLDRIAQVNPIKYGQSRNFADGAVTQLSPYISRGVISVRQVLESVLSAGYNPASIEKFIQELAWREYWQQIWIARHTDIDYDLRQPQPRDERTGLPVSILTHQTGIEAIDKGIEAFYETGYLHNHLRMYIASLACNIGRCHWKVPAQWMYYHLLDADWASNALSWQWVGGSNSSKLYFANQENINKYFHTRQKDTFLDTSYEEIAAMGIPGSLRAVEIPDWETPLPETSLPVIDPARPTLIYNFYNIDPRWRADMPANRILLLEPSVFANYPVSGKSIDFCLAVARQNIPGIQVWVGEFPALKAMVPGALFFKEHPLNQYQGIEDSRTWMSSVKGEYPSFFAYWKKVRKELF